METTRTRPIPHAFPSRPLTARLRQAITDRWRIAPERRRTHAALSRLRDDSLRDIGLTVAEVERLNIAPVVDDLDLLAQAARRRAGRW